MKAKLKASSLIETIVAMVIILLVFGIVMSFYSSQLKSVNQSNILRAHYLLNKVSSQDDLKNTYSNEELIIQSFIIRKTVTSYNKRSLYLVNYEYIDSSKNVILSKRKIVLIKDTQLL
ncbi:MAG: hypothetical protein A2W99_13290 [Bacteroidetes bacterium GWF2_33_16]|nr:MAG: hypothetical protein A2X00_00985 [Bacteroidetes bacterium GWE2_32_14]OFY06652.1 MAG: hypothetical protein A2W99_13290 [Bacteroidetes bacterium GWF2_33_16]